MLGVKPETPRTKPLMRSRKFTPHQNFDMSKGSRQRIGVPGGELYPYDGSVLLRWAGTGLREALVSTLFRVTIDGNPKIPKPLATIPELVA